MNRRSHGAFLALVFSTLVFSTLAFLTGCSSSSSTTTPPPPPVVSITATAGSGQSAVVGTAFVTQLQATVTTGGSPTSGATVTFAAPSTGASGTFAGGVNTATTDANGVATAAVFTANGTAGAYTVTAAVSGASASASFSLTNTAAAITALLPGNYTFWLSGTDANNSPYYVAGAFTADGTGTITGGEQDFVDYYYVLKQDSITGSYALTSDGNLQITLNTGDVCIGPGANNTCGQLGSTSAGNGQEILNATLTSLSSSTTSSARIAEFDAWATAGGQLEPQVAPTSTPLGGYAFSVAGLDGNNPVNPLGIGGVVNVDSSGGISGTGSVFDENDGGSLVQGQGFTTSSVDAAPDSFGRVTFTLNPTGVAQIVLVAYFVNSTHLRLVESADALVGTTGGQAFAQTGTGTFSTSSFEGSSYVLQTAGSDTTTGVLQIAGVLTGNPDGTTVGGNLSYNDLTNITPQGGSAVTSGTYLVDTTGRVTLTGVTVNGTAFNFQLYLDGNGNARVLSMDGSDVVDGVANQQTGTLSASTFSGTYAMGVIGVDRANLNEIDAVGPVVADGVGTFPGFVDLNWIFSPNPGPNVADAPVSPATFAATATAGVFTGNITGIDVTDCQVYSSGGSGCTADAFTYYMVNANTVVGIENDANQLTLLRFELQH